MDADDVVEEEAGVFDAMLSIINEESVEVTKDIILRFLHLSESHDFVRSASRELLVFYCRILLSLGRLCQTNKANSIGRECESMLTTRELPVYNTLKSVCSNITDLDTTADDLSQIVKEAYLTIALKIFHKITTVPSPQQS